MGYNYNGLQSKCFKFHDCYCLLEGIMISVPIVLHYQNLDRVHEILYCPIYYSYYSLQKITKCKNKKFESFYPRKKFKIVEKYVTLVTFFYTSI